MNTKYDQQYYNQHFSKSSQQIRAGPVPNENRSCRDIVCLILFVAIILTTLIIGAIMISDGRDYYSHVFKNTNTSYDMSGVAVVFSTQGGIIVAMFFLSLVLAILFMFALKMFPRCMVYTMIGLIYMVFVALIVLGIINQIWWMVATFAITLLIMSCMLFCFWKRLTTGIQLLQIATNFITEKPSVYLAPLYPLFFGILFFIYWVAAIVAQLYWLSYKNELAKTDSTVSTSKQTAFIVVWIFIFIFMMQFLSYVQTFFISTCCAYWYYGIQENYCLKSAVTLNRFHIGSLTFAALVITILTILRRLAAEGQQRSGNGCISCLFCLIHCCLACIEDIINTLNRNAIIVMTVTGQSYIDSAKTALSIILSEFGLFYIVDFISTLITFFGILICVGVPTLVGFLIIRYGRGADQYVSSYGAVAIFFLSIMISGLIITMVSEALACVFIFYCFDKKFRNTGIIVSNSPAAIRQFVQYGNLNPGPTTQEQLKQRPYF